MTTPEIALGILRSFPSPGQVLFSTYLSVAKIELETAGERTMQPLLDRLSDGWSWLESRNMLGPATIGSEMNPGFQRTTDRGDAWAKDARAITRIVAEEQLAFRLHPLLEPKVRLISQLADYETAAFASMKEVEIRVRGLSGKPDSLLGTKLMQAAFSADVPGPLTDSESDGGEQVALMSLFVGGIGVFKNPASHRTVNFDDPTEAAEVVMLADLLMRLLDKIERRLNSDAN